MKGIHLVLVLGAVAATCALPLDQQQKNPNVVTGVFIPSDAFKNLQDRANANSQNNQQQLQGGQPTYVAVNQNQPQYQTNQQLPLMNQQSTQPNQQPVVSNQQPILTVQQEQQQPILTVQQQQQPILTVQQQQPSLNTQQQVLTTQPANNQQLQPVVSNNQPFIYQQPLTENRDPKQSIIVMSNQPNQQPNQRIVVLQQPSSNQPIYVQQPNQLGNQGYVVPNAQSQQPTQVIFATNPSNGKQVQGTLMSSQNPNQPGSTVYTLIPINGQNNVNSNSGSSFIPAEQAGGSSSVILSTGN